MFIANSQFLAVILCFITMLCWGSWGNTQKMAAKSWRYELFYWDYVIGMVLFSLILAFTLGSFGAEGRHFIDDLAQADINSIAWVLLGAVVFNVSNILLSASTSKAGMSVAFPLGVGLSLVLGVIINYIGAPKGDPVILFIGVALIGAAFIAIGLFVSSLTENQLSAAVITIGVLLTMIVLNILSQAGSDEDGTRLITSYAVRYVLDWFSVLSRFSNFGYGILDWSALIYYVSLTFIFLYLTVRVYERRRWA